MITKLRNKYFLTNFLLMSAVFAGILVIIYILAWMQAYRAASLKLTISMSAPFEYLERDPAKPIAFTAILNQNDTLNLSVIDQTLSKSTIDQAVSLAMHNYKESNIVQAGAHSFMFVRHRSLDYKLRILFTDFTQARNNLHDLLKILLGIAVLSMFLLLWVSYIIAKRSIQPIKIMFEKEQRFITDISHNLKTPLTVMSTNLAVITMHQEDTVQSQSKWIGYIRSQIDRMSMLINDMLTLAKLDSLDAELVLRKINISKMLESSLLSMEEVLYSKNISLKMQIEPDIRITADVSSITQLIDILMDNAAKYTPQEGRITVTLTSNNKYAAITFTNTGDGIDTRHIARLFDRFYQTNPSNNGNGLGLSIAKSIVQRHNGTIEVHSNVGEHTSFSVKLPFVHPERVTEEQQ